jgi:hypothetical protein
MGWATFWSIFSTTHRVALIFPPFSQLSIVDGSIFSLSIDNVGSRLVKDIRGNQGCQMVYLQTKIPILGKFWMALEWKMLVHFMIISNISQSFDIIYGRWVKFVIIWYIFSPFGMFGPRKIWQPWW